MIKIWKGGDIKLPVSSISGLGDKYKIYFYTKHADVYFSKTDQDVVSGTQPYIPLNWSDLSQIGDGVLNLRVNTYTVNMAYDDEVYDNTFTRTTNYYIVNEENPQDDPKSLTERVEELEVGLAEEIERSVTFDDNTTNLINTLSEDLEDEETAREAADAQIQTNLNTVNDGLNETIIQLTNEITNRQQADNLLSQNITSEAQQRQLADGNLQTAIDANASAISDIEDELELYALKADVYNKSQIDGKVSDINTSIGSEESSRIAGDENLQTQINQKANSADVYTKNSVDTLLNNKADKSTTYTKTEVDSALASKANSADVYGKNEVYTKSETDAAINAHTPDLSNYYTKSETDTALSGKANSADVYTKTQIDNTLSGYETTSAHSADMALKADKATTYTKTEVDTAFGNYYDKSVIDANELVTASALNDLNTNKADKSTTYTKSETDTAISTAVGTETTARQNADSALDTRVTALENAPAPTPYDDTEIRQIIQDNELVTASAISDLQDADAVLAGANASMDARVTVLESSIPDMSNYYTKSEVDADMALKADEATTIAGYGITDAYTKTEIDATIGDINTILQSI